MNSGLEYNNLSTVVEILRWRAHVEPELTGICFLVDGENQEETLTYQQLYQRSSSLAAHIRKICSKEDRVVLFLPPGIHYIVSFYACLCAGVIAVPVYPPHPLRFETSYSKIASIVEDADPRLILCDAGMDEAMERMTSLPVALQSASRIDVTSSDVQSEGWADESVGPTDIAFLQYTSGSTADPRGVMVRHSNLMNNLKLIQHCLKLERDMTGVSWLPPYHDMGLIGSILYPVYSGIRIVLMSPMHFLQRPIRWLNAIDRFRATCSIGPNFAYDFCVQKISDEQRSHLNLSCWKIAMNGAEPIHYETLLRFAQRFSDVGFDFNAFLPCYGIAESTLLISGKAADEKPRIFSVDSEALSNGCVKLTASDSAAVKYLVACGRPSAGYDVRIVDPELGTECKESMVGEIWLRSGSTTGGYWRNPRSTDETFKVVLHDNGEHYIRTGDLGCIVDNQIIVTGRRKELIIVDGRNHYPQDIEQTVQQCDDSIRAHSCVAFSIESHQREELIIALELEPRSTTPHDIIARKIRTAVSDLHNIVVHDIQFLSLGGIPRTSSGKLRRVLCKRRYVQSLTHNEEQS